MLRPKSTQNRKIGIHASIVGLLEAEESRQHALLEDEHHQAVGRAHREQVHQDRLGRDDDRAEREHQQQETSERTKAKTQGVYWLSTSRKSRLSAVWPVTRCQPRNLADGLGQDRGAQLADGVVGFVAVAGHRECGGQDGGGAIGIPRRLGGDWLEMVGLVESGDETAGSRVPFPPWGHRSRSRRD